MHMAALSRDLKAAYNKLAFARTDLKEKIEEQNTRITKTYQELDVVKRSYAAAVPDVAKYKSIVEALPNATEFLAEWESTRGIVRTKEKLKK